MVIRLSLVELEISRKDQFYKALDQCLNFDNQI